MSFTPNYLSDPEMELLSLPGVLFRLKAVAATGRVSREDLKHLQRDLAQFRRAEDGDRARPDLDSPEANPSSVANQHGYPTPHMPRDTHRPDRVANPEVMGHMRNINQRLEDEQITDALQRKMGTDADRPLPPPTLRDQIAAAVSIHGTPTSTD